MYVLHVFLTLRPDKPLQGPSQQHPSNPHLQSTTSIFDNLLRDIPELARPSNIVRPLKHNAAHHIVKTGPPVYARARRLAPERLQIARKEFDDM